MLGLATSKEFSSRRSVYGRPTAAAPRCNLDRCPSRPDRKQYCKEHEHDKNRSYLQQRWSRKSEVGGQCRTRTCDLLLVRQAL